MINGGPVFVRRRHDEDRAYVKKFEQGGERLMESVSLRIPIDHIGQNT